MLKNVTKIVTLVCVLGLVSDLAVAQRGGGGGPRGGGQGGRGGGQGGGMCSRTNGTGASGNQSTAAMTNFFANSSSNTNLANMQRQQMQRFQNNATTASSSAIAANRRRPTNAQFVQAAFRLDADSDGELDSAELTEVATAVIKELRSRHPTPPPSPTGYYAMANARRPPGNAIPPNASMQILTTAFVSKALKYDRDDSGTLNAAETRALAAVFIRSLG